VAAGNPSTAAVGAEVLRQGGNAADAAVAATCAAMTAEASLTGLGAGGFALVHTPDGAAEVLDFFVAAAGRGRTSADRARRSNLDRYEVPFKATTQTFCVGPSSCATPGIVPGLAELHARHGRLPLPQVLAPAIALARSGSPLVPAQDYLHDILEGILTGTPGMRAIFAPDGRLLRSGETLVVPGLADALEAFARGGAEPFTHGAYATAVADFMQTTGGLVSAADLAEYRVVVRRPAAIDYRGTQVLTNPLPSSGGTLIAFTLALLARFPVADRSEPERAQMLVDALTATDRARREGFDLHRNEPGFGDHFLSAEHLDSSARLLHEQAHGNTTHISVIDADGLTVALTSSCGSGSGVVVEGTGIIMNNMMGEEDLNPGGFFALPPGERLTSMMAPTIAWRTGGTGGPDGPNHAEQLIAVGSAGSERLRSAIVQVLVNMLDRGMEAQAAIDAPRLHLDRGTVHLEAGIPPDVAAHMEARGERVHVWPVTDLYFGGAQVAGRRREAGGVGYDGGGDPRRGGAAIIVE
jgi:gamma-glutamyltranspeptidase/glutathione hydrolase